MRNKKAQSMSGPVTAFIALILAVGIAIITSILTSVIAGNTYQTSETLIDATAQRSVVNESITILANNQTQYLNYVLVESGTLVVVNSSNGVDVGLGNFTINYNNGGLSLKTTKWVNISLGASYDAGPDIAGSIRDSAVKGFSVIENTANYGQLIVLAVIIAIIFTVILGIGAFSMNGKGNYGGSL